MLQEILADYTIKTYLLIEDLTSFDGPPFLGITWKNMERVFGLAEMPSLFCHFNLTHCFSNF